MSLKQRPKFDAKFSDLDYHSIRQRQKSLGGTPSPKTPGTAREDRIGNINPFNSIKSLAVEQNMSSMETKADVGSRGSLRDPPAMEAPKESVVSRLILTPLTFISFLLSLALVDTRNHIQRTRQHTHPPSGPPTPDTLFNRVKLFSHNIIFKPVNSSPYSYVGKGEGSVEGEEGDEKWFWHTKQRKLMKAEMDDAFRLRNSVAALLVASVVLGVMAVLGGVRWACGLLTGWL